MAPRRQRAKVGLTRMDAALDAMRPMGFPADVVRKCVKQLLKVYGNDGWVFLEESAYKLLIDTILEEPEDMTQEDSVHSENPQLEHHLPGESSHDNHQQDETVHHLRGKQVMVQEKAKVSNNDFNIGKEVKQEQGMLGDIRVQKEIKVEQGLDDDELSPMPLQDANFSLPLPDTTPQLTVHTPANKRRRPCYGWISDDEDDDKHYNFLQLTTGSEV